MKKIEKSKHLVLKEIPFGHVAEVPGYGWVIVLKPCPAMKEIGKRYVAVAVVNQDHIALLEEDLPAWHLGPAEVGYERT